MATAAVAGSSQSWSAAEDVVDHTAATQQDRSGFAPPPRPAYIASDGGAFIRSAPSRGASDTVSVRTPITPPSAYLDFLRSTSPGRPTTSTQASDHGSEAGTTKSTIPYIPRTTVQPKRAALQSRREATEYILSAIGSGSSSRTSLPSIEVESQNYLANVQSHATDDRSRGRAKPVRVRHVVTRTVSYNRLPSQEHADAAVGVGQIESASVDPTAAPLPWAHEKKRLEAAAQDSAFIEYQQQRHVENSTSTTGPDDLYQTTNEDGEVALKRDDADAVLETRALSQLRALRKEQSDGKRPYDLVTQSQIRGFSSISPQTWEELYALALTNKIEYVLIAKRSDTDISLERLRTSISALKEINTSVEHLTDLFLRDTVLQQAFVRARAEPSICADDFETQVRAQLNELTNIYWTTKGVPKRAAVKFVYYSARDIAHAIRRDIYGDLTDQLEEATLRSKRLVDLWIKTGGLRAGVRGAKGVDDTSRMENDRGAVEADAASEFYATMLDYSQGFELKFLRFCLQRFADSPATIRNAIAQKWRTETSRNLPFVFFADFHEPQLRFEKDAERPVIVKEGPRELTGRIKQANSESEVSMKWSHQVHVGFLEKLRHYFGDFGGDKMDWSPFRAPVAPLEEGKVRISWSYSKTGEYHHEDISSSLASLLSKHLADGTFVGQSLATLSKNQDHAARPRDEQQPSTSTPTDQSSSVQDMQAPAQDHTQGSYALPDQQTASPTAKNGAEHSIVGDHHILFCVPVAGQRSAQIRVKALLTDTAFFEHLRAEYRGARGVLRYYLSPKRFWHCQFSRMTRWAPGQLTWIRAEVPPQEEQDYTFKPRPPDDPYVEPIRPDEWSMRFHRKIDTGQSLEALPLIPKRCKAFQVSTHVNGREDMWGLHVEYCYSIVGIFCYCVLLIGGPVAFWVWWLRCHPGDWQTATTLLMTVMTMLTAIWYTGGEEIKKMI